MPEIVTKHPKVVLKLLSDSGASCGVGAKQNILINCPPENFCALSMGELCVYDVKHIATMHQIDPIDLHEAISRVPTMFSFANITLLAIIFLIGFWVGARKS
ncbi:MAG TPA: hypothetical protein VJN02_05765 [Gammaproteobacteria bacterium]|nr:hypothetical protein [Gammaproteobacteria bacterium]